MGNSLREAFLNAGLVLNEAPPDLTLDRNHKNHKNTNKNDNKNDRKNSNKNKPGSNDNKTESKTTVTVGTKRFKPPTPAKSAHAEKQYSPSDRDARIKIPDRRIRTLIDRHRVNVDSAEIEFNFERGGRIKRLYVTNEQRDQLQSGTLVIVGFGGNHHLIPLAASTEIGDIRSDVFIYSITPTDRDSNGHIEKPQRDGGLGEGT